MHKRIPQLNNHSVELEILTPLHIGTGQDLDPFSYVIQGDRLYFIDLIRWMDAYPDKASLNRIFESDNFAAVRTFIARNVSGHEFGTASIPVGSPVLLETYRRVIDKQDPRNQVLINPTMRNDVIMQAFIPGSSLKGAIRTALSSHFVRAAGVTSRDARRSGQNPDYNEKIFGHINHDPMRWLKVPDVPMGTDATAIVEARERAKDPGKKATPKGYYEIIQGMSITGKSSVYPITISLAPFELWNEKVTLEFIIEALYRFYIPKYLDEYAKFYRDTAIEGALKPVNEIIDDMKTNETLLRVGHFSHVECVTLDGIRNPRTRKGRNGEPLPYGTTRTLASGLYPFGWVKIRFRDLVGKERKPLNWISGEEATETIDRSPDMPIHKQKALQGNSERQTELKRQDAEVAKRKAMEEEERRKEEAREKAEFDAMTPEERDLVTLADPGITEQQVFDIFGRIGGFSEENKKLAAMATKTYWKQHDRWNKKDCSKKQWTKVQRIKEMLGDL